MSGFETNDFIRGSGIIAGHIQGGATIAAYTTVTVNGNSQWVNTDADNVDTMPVMGLAMETLRANKKGRVLIQGFTNNNDWTWTPGALLYASTTTGELTENPPTGINDVVQEIGKAVTATFIYFSGSGLGNVSGITSKFFQFTEAVNGAIATSSPTGVDVDATTEAAVAWGQLPNDLQQVLRIKIWGVATAGPINAGGQMHLEITFNAGASNAAYNEAGKSWSLTNFDGEETDYVADDVIHWVIEDGDVGNELSSLSAGDSFEILAIWEDGSDPDGATDCLFRVVEVEYT